MERELDTPSHLKNQSVLYDHRRLDGTHSWFARHASGDNDNVSPLQSLGKTVIWRQVALNFGRSCDVREVGGNARGVDNIKETELEDVRVSVGVLFHDMGETNGPR
jgi:hypothetical protein